MDERPSFIRLPINHWGSKAMRVHFVVHESFEAPGAFATWVTERGHEATYSRVYLNDPLPPSIENIELLVVLGGPQSPSTTKEECPHFDAAAECALIAQFVNAGRAVVGVCLGSQLIGQALGAQHERSPEKEIGKFPITLTAEGRVNEKFSHFGETLEVGHWHNDMPGLTDSAKIIAFSEGCPRQIIEYGDLVYGFQCHMEFTPDEVELLIEASHRELAALTNHRFVQQPAALRANNYRAMNQKLFGFLDKLVASLQLGPVIKAGVS
ncbi:type 1 glutamine amidotransferase [Acidovorax sp. SUPP950]|uniref:type 1 glutamine amidotransferase n=1 Tax=Acidovorax sp. SUPP950 TaxID=511901 RepID=UPI0023CFC11B|nr:type 1 glutamine amidotransferase [Acidovorax sp. SUPP950]GKS77395.1 type 1 glutamine amidotransferase [Acidovorax sp. SUPP950]